MTSRDTVADMADRAISVRLDPDADAALEVLVRAGMSQSQAIRASLVEAAQRRAGVRSLAAEAARLSVDEVDRAEVARVRAFLDDIDASW
jgi:Arc/MetJ-type ribon-helix-helix transcriptional regulator